MSAQDREIVYVQRPAHTIAAAGGSVPRIDLKADMEHYGEFNWSRSTRDSLLGERDIVGTPSWDVNITRRQPHHDDEYPLSMPESIGNCGFRATEADAVFGDEYDALYMSHLYVQEPARRKGYAQLLWDCYLAVAAVYRLDLNGGVGSTEGGGTVGFLQSQGVPLSAINPGREAGGGGLTKWSVDYETVAATAPIVREKVGE